LKEKATQVSRTPRHTIMPAARGCKCLGGGAAGTVAQTAPICFTITRTGRLPRLPDGADVPAVPLASMHSRDSGDAAVMLYYVIMGVLLVGLIVLFFVLRKKGQ
jgi:hypothetical protein